ncbi:cytidine deaminase [Streptomyces sp. NPDC050560]|uniref:cytidine deaminase n=1 Tax=Streptomyces sp. NPDC050560 TaxID=3365630 RepID=UPI0037B1886F
MTTPTRRADLELVRAAADVARTRCRGDNHTMAAAARARDGRIVTAVNAYHFTGGPCAELVLVGTAAAQGAYDLETVVAVGDRDRGVVPPCGRCRQVLLDYFPRLRVIVAADGGVGGGGAGGVGASVGGVGAGVGGDGVIRVVPIVDLLPAAYVWGEHQ